MQLTAIIYPDSDTDWLVAECPETGTASQAEQRYKAQSAHGFDSAGRTQWSASALGVLRQNTYDTESNLIQTGRYTNAIAQIDSYAYDRQSRLLVAWSNLGAGIAGRRWSGGLPPNGCEPRRSRHHLWGLRQGAGEP